MASYAFDASENQTLNYTGAQSSILFKMFSIANIKMSNSGAVLYVDPLVMHLICIII